MMAEPGPSDRRSPDLQHQEAGLAEARRKEPGAGTTERFIQFYHLAHRRISACILSMVPNRAEAEDIMQATSLALWQQFGTFREGGDFTNWACGVAYRQTLKYFREHKHRSLRFREEVMGRIAEFRNQHRDVLEARSLALSECLKKLSHQDRELVTVYATDEVTMKTVAERLRRPANTVYKALKRIRLLLMQCVDRAMATGGA